MVDRFFLAGRSKYGFAIVHDSSINRSSSFIPEYDVGGVIDRLNRDESAAEDYRWQSPRRQPDTPHTRTLRNPWIG